MTEQAPPPTEGPADSSHHSLMHHHECDIVTALPRLQSIHDSLRWDVGKSRIVSVGVCRICGEPDRESVQECSDVDCHAHRICQRPYR